MTGKRTEFSSGAAPPWAPRLFEGLRPLDRAGAVRDALAGMTLASMNIPQTVLVGFLTGVDTRTALTMRRMAGRRTWESIGSGCDHGCQGYTR